MVDPTDAAPLDLEQNSPPPTGLTHALLKDRLFQQACRDEGITLAELRSADELAAKITQAKRLHQSGSLSADEYGAKIFGLLGAGPEAIDATLNRYSKRHAGLVQTVLEAMDRLKNDLDEKLPVPPEIDEEVFFSAHFQSACELASVTLKDVCKFERTRADYLRLKRLRTDERISDEEYAAKVERLFGVPEQKADQTLTSLHKTQQDLIEQLLASTQRIKHAEWEADQQAAIARKKQEDYVAELNRQVEQKIEQARRKAEGDVARLRTALEKALIHRGVEGVVRTVEMVDRYLATPYLRKKAPPDVAMVPKTTAGMERKKLWLIERNSKAQAKIKPTPAHAGDSQQQETSQRSDSLQPQRALTALEKREMLIQEKAEQIKMKESRKLLLMEMQMKEIEANQRKKRQLAEQKQIQKETAVKEMQWAKQQRAEQVLNRLNNVDSRIQAFKEVQQQQRMAIAAIQKKAREEENMLKSLIFRVESDFGFRPEGVAMDFDKIERHVQARSSRLLKTSDSICTPELEVPIPRSRPSSAAQEGPDTRTDFKRNQLRPSSAPPSGPANGGTLNMPPRPAPAISGSFRPGTASSKGRPGTAQSRLSRGIPEDGIPDDISEISGEDDVASLRMARMEKLRIEQGKNLYHIVREEQELEKERLRMLSAVQPKKVAHLNRLFEHERQEASERIMRVAAENEMVLLQEMALVAASEEPQFEDV